MRYLNYQLVSASFTAVAIALLPGSFAQAAGLNPGQVSELGEAQAVLAGMPRYVETAALLNNFTFGFPSTNCTPAPGAGGNWWNPGGTTTTPTTPVPGSGSSWWNPGGTTGNNPGPVPNPIKGPGGFQFNAKSDIPAKELPGAGAGTLPGPTTPDNPFPLPSASPLPVASPLPTCVSNPLPWDPAFPGTVPANGVLGQIDEGVTILSHIVNLGQSIWQIIQNNAPVVNIATTSATAMPQGITDWTQLAGMKPVYKDFEVKVPGDNGKTVIDFIFRVAFEAGGSVNGKGKYIGQILIPIAKVNVGFGHTFNAKISVPSVVNAGTVDDPLAEAVIQIEYQQSTAFLSRTGSVDLVIMGDGTIQNISKSEDGTPPEAISPF